MTREEAIKELSYIADEMPSMECADWKKAISVAIKALEQESFKPMVEIDLYSVIKQKYIEREVLDKVRAEIKQYQSDYDVHGTEYDRTAWKAFNRCLQILDKYKAESEDE